MLSIVGKTKENNSSTYSYRDSKGNTCLHYAAFKHDHGLLEEIFSCQPSVALAAVNATNDVGLSPLAAAFWDIKGESVLLETLKVRPSHSLVFFYILDVFSLFRN